MTSYLFDFMPFFTGGIMALSLLFRIYKRSIATFIIIISQTIVVNLIIYGYIHEALLTIQQSPYQVSYLIHDQQHITILQFLQGYSY